MRRAPPAGLTFTSRAQIQTRVLISCREIESFGKKPADIKETKQPINKRAVFRQKSLTQRNIFIACVLLFLTFSLCFSFPFLFEIIMTFPLPFPPSFVLSFIFPFYLNLASIFLLNWCLLSLPVSPPFFPSLLSIPSHLQGT